MYSISDVTDIHKSEQISKTSPNCKNIALKVMTELENGYVTFFRFCHHFHADMLKIDTGSDVSPATDKI